LAQISSLASPTFLLYRPSLNLLTRVFSVQKQEIFIRDFLLFNPHLLSSYFFLFLEISYKTFICPSSITLADFVKSEKEFNRVIEVSPAA